MIYFQMCLNPALAIHSGDMPPPLYICSDCADFLRTDHGEYMVDLLLPMPHVSSTCENKVLIIHNVYKKSIKWRMGLFKPAIPSLIFAI